RVVFRRLDGQVAERHVDHADVQARLVLDAPVDGLHDVGDEARAERVEDAHVDELYAGRHADVRRLRRPAGGAAAGENAGDVRAVAVPVAAAVVRIDEIDGVDDAVHQVGVR